MNTLVAKALAVAAFLIGLSHLSHAQFGSDPAKPQLLANVESIQPGETFTLAVKFEIDGKWHIYWANPGASGLPTEVSLDLPEGFDAGPVQFPVPKEFTTAGMVGFGYEKSATFVVEVQAPADLEVGSKVTLKASASWLSCDDKSCRAPQNTELNLELPVLADPPKPSANSGAIEAARSSLPQHPKEYVFEAKAENGELIAELSIAEATFVNGAQLLPIEQGVLGADKPQTVEFSGSKVTIRHPLASGSESLPEPFLALVKSGGSGAAFLVSTGGYAEAGSETATEQPANETEKTETADFEAQQAAVQTMVSWGVAERDEKGANIVLLVIFAFLGGVILNLMPCVFPVLAIKVLGFVQHGGEWQATARRHGLAFGAGVLASMWVLAAIVLTVKILGNDQLLWGQQFQNPAFVVGMVVLMFVFGLNLAGVFEIGTKLTGVGQELQTKDGLGGSFFSGILIVLVSTPCSGPFMAAALGPALSGPKGFEFILLTALGLGLAFPYVFLSYIPALVEKLPRPGAWMETFKQLMSFPMFAAAVWLIMVYARHTGSVNPGLGYFLYGLVILALGLWIYGRYAVPYKSAGAQWFGRVAPLVLAGVFVYLTHSGFVKAQEILEKSIATGDEVLNENQVAKYGIVWDKIDAVEVVQHRKKKRTVFIDFTADW